MNIPLASADGCIKKAFGSDMVTWTTSGVIVQSTYNILCCWDTGGHWDQNRPEEHCKSS